MRYAQRRHLTTLYRLALLLLLGQLGVVLSQLGRRTAEISASAGEVSGWLLGSVGWLSMRLALTLAVCVLLPVARLALAVVEDRPTLRAARAPIMGVMLMSAAALLSAPLWFGQGGHSLWTLTSVGTLTGFPLALLYGALAWARSTPTPTPTRLQADDPDDEGLDARLERLREQP